MKKKILKLLILPAVPNMQKVVDKFSFPIELTRGNYEDLQIIFQEKKLRVLYQGSDIKNFDFVWLCSSWKTREIAQAVGDYLFENNIPSTAVEKSPSKLTDQMLFSINKIKTPESLFLGAHQVKKNLFLIKEVCGYPIVVKDTKGSRGDGVYKFMNEKELIQKADCLKKNILYIFQKYIPNEYDWGVMVADGVVVSGEKSYPSSGEFRNNACNGAKEIFVACDKIPEKIKKIAIQASQVLSLPWSRADIIIDKDTKLPYLLEVNRLPGITAKTNEVEGAHLYLASLLTGLDNKCW